MSAFGFWSQSPWLSVLFLLTALSAVSTLRWSRAFTERVKVLNVALRNRMSAGHATDAAAGTTGQVDANELARLLSRYAPGRDYLTAYDFARLHEGERIRAAMTGRPGVVRRLVTRWIAPRQTARLLDAFADLVVEEDRKLVPAITKGVLFKVYRP